MLYGNNTANDSHTVVWTAHKADISVYTCAGVKNWYLFCSSVNYLKYVSCRIPYMVMQARVNSWYKV